MSMDVDVIKTEMAIELYKEEKISLSRAAEIAGMSTESFKNILEQRVHDPYLYGTPSVERGDDKEWGLTDCISFIVMGDPGLTDALTADEHFEQAGFRALLRENV